MVHARLLLPLLLALGLINRPHAFAQAGPPHPNPATKEESAENAAVIEELSTSVRFENDGSGHQTVRERVKILTEAGLREYGIVTFNFSVADNFELQSVEVHKKDGAVVKAGPANIHETTPEVSRAAPVYSDLRQKQVTVPGLSVGDEVLFQYSTAQPPIVPKQFWFQYSFAKNMVIDSESVEIDLPRDRKVQIHYTAEYKPAIEDSGNRVLYRWHVSNNKVETAAAVKKEQQDQFARGTLPPPSIQLSTFGSWEEVGSWYFDLQRERLALTPAIKAKALELTSGKTEPQAKVKALYQFVSLDFRYIGLDFGIGRYQPHPAAEVLANKYGDCKDKHTLLAALLSAVGIQSYPVLISSHRQLEMGVPSPAQFDHLITAVPVGNETVLLDTTAEVAPYGMLLLPLRHKSALLVSGEGKSRFIETPSQPPFQAQEVFDLNGRLDDSGSMEADVSYLIHSDAEIYLKAAFLHTSPEKYKDLVQLLSYTAGFGGDVTNVKVAGLHELDEPLRMTYHYHRANYVDLHDEAPKNSLPLASTHLQKWDDTKNTMPLYAGPGELVYQCRVELPAGITVQPPLPVKLSREYATYKSEYAVDKNVLTGERSLKVIAPEITAIHRQDYEAFQRAIDADEGQQMVLHVPTGFLAKSASAGNTDELMNQAEMEYRDRNYADAYADYRKVADQDPKRKGVWTQIGLVEFALHRNEQAIADFQKAIQADPFDAQAHAELGAVYMTVQRSEMGVTEVKKAIEVAPLSHRAHYLLGWYYAQEKHDYEAAVPELEKALATEADRFNDQPQIRGFLATGYFKLKQPEKAVEQLKSIVEASPIPPTWNNAAYTLAENSYELGLARQYVDSALKAIYERLNQVQADAIRSTDMSAVQLLSMTWDTKGWVEFKGGNVALAEKYVRGAWILAQGREEADHLGQIYEKLGRTQDAIHFYSLAARPSFASLPHVPPDPARQHLVHLVGAQRAEQLVRDSAGQPSQMRTLHLGNIAPPGTKGEFYFTFSPGPKLLDVQLAGGDQRLIEPLRKQESKIAGTVLFPEAAPEKLIRQGFVTCSRYSRSCDLVFYTSDIPAGASATMR